MQASNSSPPIPQKWMSSCLVACKYKCYTFLHYRRRRWHPLQYSCLENPRDGGAWWAAVYGVTQSQTRLKRLSSSGSSLHYSSTSVGWLCCTGSGLGGWESGPKLGSQTHWTWLETLRAVSPNSPLVSATCCVPSLFLWPSWRHLLSEMLCDIFSTQRLLLIHSLGLWWSCQGCYHQETPKLLTLGGRPGRTGVLWSPWWTWAPGRMASSHITHPLNCTALATPASFCSLKLVGTHQPVSPARETEHNPMDPASHLWKT